MKKINLLIGAAVIAFSFSSAASAADSEMEKCYGLAKTGKQIARTPTDSTDEDPRVPGKQNKLATDYPILPPNQDVAKKDKKNIEIAEEGVDPHTWDGYGYTMVQKGTCANSGGSLKPLQ